jgi:nitrogen-specific signal transduction histidine kinase/CheY-like chemotaxis protein
VLAPVLRAHYRLKVLRDEMRETHQRLRTLQKKLLRSERLKALGEIASGVAHDFNNALGIILGRSQMLREKLTEPGMRKDLILIERAAQDVAMSVRRILDFFRPESKGKFAPHFLDNLIQECLEVTKVRWKEEAHLRGIRYEITTQVPRGQRIWGNDNEMCEVFNNLIFNALDAMPDGGSLDVRAELEDETVVLTFADTGAGMTPEILGQVYDPFFTTKNEKGTGLGLSLVRGIILRHHGEMDVDSVPDKGTTFRIRLPLYEGEEEIAQPVPVEISMAVDGDATASSSLRVLIVEDEPEILALMAEILDKHGYDTVTASNGAEAMRVLGGNEFHVVIADLGMPEMTGWEVIAEARRMLPHARYIITTGWGDSFVDVDLKARGVDHVLPKPVEVQSLVDLMEHIRSTWVTAASAKTAQAPSTS